MPDNFGVGVKPPSERVTRPFPARAVAVFALGYAGPAFAPPPVCPGHPSCKDDSGSSGGSGKDALYSAVITRAVSGVSGEMHWRGNFAGKKGLGRNTGGSEATDGNNVGQLNLSFFTESATNPFPGDEGKNCFVPDPNIVDPDPPIVYLGQAVVKSGKRGQAEGMFWFRAKDENGSTDVGYLLTMIGDFSNAAWPPTTDPVTMTLRTWKLSAVNEDSTVQDMSCLGEDGFSGRNDVVEIVVTLVPPPD